ncbi:MAG: hypothetical protein ACKN9U_06675, partial [Pirellulaceae bacterium]
MKSVRYFVPAAWSLRAAIVFFGLLCIPDMLQSTFAQDAAVLESGAPPVSIEALEARLKGLEAYLGNVAPVENTPSAGIPGPGHNAWLMTSAALVLFMTLPGLALFYGGLVRKKNVLSVIAQCFGCAGLVTILWVTFGYSMVFGEGGSPFLGSTKHL